MNKGTILSTLSTMLCAAILSLSPSVKTQAAEEVQIPTNTIITDCLQTSDDVNLYSFTMDTTGYFTVSFEKKNANDDAESGWIIKLLDGDKKDFYSQRVDGSQYQTYKLPFRKDQKLHIQIISYYQYGSPIDVDYNIKVTTYTASNWEGEYNDTLSKANSLKTDTLCYGNLHTSYDVDYYKYTVTKAGCQTFSFHPLDPGLDVGSGWKIDIYDQATNAKLYTYGGVKTKMTSATMNFKKGTKLLIVVRADYSYSAPVYQDYSILIKEKEAENWERENRVTSSEGWTTYKRSATSLCNNVTFNGNLWNSSDEDLYKITVSNPGYIAITFNPNDIPDNLENGFDVTLLNSSGKTIHEDSGVTSKRSGKYYLNERTYYYQVRANYYYHSPGPSTIYKIKTEFTKYTPAKVASVPASKAKISWKKQTKIDGYEVSYATKSSFSGAKVVTTTKNTKTLSLASGKKYYVRVRSFKETATGKKVYGPWSKTITTKR